MLDPRLGSNRAGLELEATRLQKWNWWMPVLREESQFSRGFEGRISDRKLKDKAIINYRKNIAKYTPERKFNHSIPCVSGINNI